MGTISLLEKKKQKKQEVERNVIESYKGWERKKMAPSDTKPQKCLIKNFASLRCLKLFWACFIFCLLVVIVVVFPDSGTNPFVQLEMRCEFVIVLPPDNVSL